MIRFLTFALIAMPAFGQATLPYILSRIEERYNRAKTLKVTFHEEYTSGGRARKIESGDLFLRKPGKMRWDYREPLGKLFISDGKNLYLYTPQGKRAEKMKLKETDDLRAPLAFLLGKLHFERDFTNFAMKQDGQDWEITAEPKSDKLPYRRVEFVVTPEFQIKRLNVIGQDASVLGFHFANETMNPPLGDRIFQFKLPPGVTFVDSSETAGQPVEAQSAGR
ncbi:MAG TPA: outer membrane lipoprotein chaperone LolA [Bryobacteraceae bacterium]|nr:outer membrane lipoprotein chaperone LolA [Bryobacteraceae bacterium]